MHFRLHCILHLLIAASFASAAAIPSEAQTPAAPPAAPQSATPAGAATIRGHITDQTGALIPGAKITILDSSGKAIRTVTADTGGAYEARGLAPGNYIVKAEYDGFAPFQSQAIAITAGQGKRVDIAMAIQVEQQNVVVTDETPSVNVEAGGNASSVVLKGKDLDALSDDPDELSNELQALAGPSAGPNGGQIYIDGFTGGQLPPKSAIREIRINQNPFSAEFDKLGYGRIEILTKPGTDKLHGQIMAMGNDKSFNTGSPFASNLPSYDSYMFNGSVSGALSKKASFFFSAQQRDTSDAYVYTARLSPDLTVPALTGGVYSPRVRTNLSPRLDLQLGSKNTLTMRYQFWRDSESGVLGATTNLPSQATGSTSYENTLQISDAEVINDHIVNETRFQYMRETGTDTSVSTAPQVQVPGYFSSGGSNSQYSNDHQDHYELWNITTLSAGRHAIKFGTRLRDNRDANSTTANFNGTFSFADLTHYQAGQPNKLTYTYGPTAAIANVFDAALFLQDDWKVNRFLTASGGMRWESQNHISDHNDWAPRVAFAYALDGHRQGAQPKTVLRGGYGMFYDRFALSNMITAVRQSGGANSQKQVTISNPTCFDANSLANITPNPADLPSYCGTPISSSNTTVQIAPGFRSPYTQQIGGSIERQVNKATTVTATYLRSFGVHQLVTRNANQCYDWDFATGTCPDPGSNYPTGAPGIVNQFYPEAVFKQNQVIVNVNARLRPNFSVFGFYNWTDAKSDGGTGSTASNAYNLSQDYGRAAFASTNMVFMMANYTARWAIRFNPFLIAQSGKPYNILTNNDVTGNNFFNDRPAYANASQCSSGSSQFVQTSLGCLDTVPQAGESLVPMNLGNGPASVSLNLRISRAFGIGPLIESSNSRNAGGPPGDGGGHGGGYGGGRGGAPGGGLGPGGLGGGGGGPRGMFGPSSTGRKYSLTFNVQALNLFNNVDYGQPTGTIAPLLDQSTGVYGPGDRFGHSYSLAKGMFASPTSSAVRRVFLQMEFSF